MSVLIKGMAMPTSCRACMFSRTDIRNVDWCVLTEKDLPCDCPIVPVPPHGDLIDRDALKFRLKTETGYAGSQQITTDFLCVLKSDIVNAPTIIESEEEDG